VALEKLTAGDSTEVASMTMTDGLENCEKASRRVFRRYFPLLLILWIVFVLYPNPLNFVISIERVRAFEVDPYAIEPMLSELPFDPTSVEKAVLARIPYRHDWEVYGMPWYCPTVEQVLERGEGDCKGRALVLASVLEAKNVTYQVHLSPIHIWVEYEGKNETSMENPQVEFYRYDPDSGERQFQIPHIRLGEVMDSFGDAFWDPMPGARKALLISGLLALIAARIILRKRKAVPLAAG